MTVASLAGIRVVAVATNVPGPVAAGRLRALGASVTKVEPPEGDPLSSAAPAWYAVLVADCAVHRLDLRAPAGRAALDEILAAADLLLTALRPAALARLGLDDAGLRERFPRLARVAIVGHAAPEEDRPGHDLTYLAPHGLVAPPGLPRTLVADLLGAERAVTAALALLFARERGGGAGATVVALADAARDAAAPLRTGLTAPDGALGGAFPGYGLYRARSGWVAIAALEERFRARLSTALGVPLDRNALERAFRARTGDEWEEWARARDLPIAAVRGEATA